MPPRRRRCQARAAHPGKRYCLCLRGGGAARRGRRTQAHGAARLVLQQGQVHIHQPARPPPLRLPARRVAHGLPQLHAAACWPCMSGGGQALCGQTGHASLARARGARLLARVWSAYVTTGRPSGGRPLTTCFALCGKCRREIAWWVHRPRELRRAPCAGVEPAPRKQGPGRVLRAHQSPAACSSSAAEEPPARSVFKGGSCSPIAPRGDRVQVRGAARAPPRLCQRLRATAADGRSAVEDHRTPRTPPGLRRCRRVRG